MKDIDVPLENQFNKHIYMLAPQATDDDYREDVKGRKYRNIAHDATSAYDEYVAEANVTVPRYLILFEAELKTKSNTRVIVIEYNYKLNIITNLLKSNLFSWIILY